MQPIAGEREALAAGLEDKSEMQIFARGLASSPSLAPSQADNAVLIGHNLQPQCRKQNATWNFFYIFSFSSQALRMLFWPGNIMEELISIEHI